MHESVYDAFLEKFVAVVEAAKIGDPFDPTVTFGPVISAGDAERILGVIDQAVTDKSGELITGGKRIGGDLAEGYYIQPTVFGNVDNSSTIAQEEIFGPVLSVIPAADEQDAVRIANDTIYGLNSAVFTPDPDRARAVARNLRAGTVGMNSFRTDFGIAFGGFKQSGIGREGGAEGLAHFLETKTVILDEPPARYREGAQ